MPLSGVPKMPPNGQNVDLKMRKIGTELQKWAQEAIGPTDRQSLNKFIFTPKTDTKNVNIPQKPNNWVRL